MMTRLPQSLLMELPLLPGGAPNFEATEAWRSNAVRDYLKVQNGRFHDLLLKLCELKARAHLSIELEAAHITIPNNPSEWESAEQPGHLRGLLTEFGSRLAHGTKEKEREKELRRTKAFPVVPGRY